MLGKIDLLEKYFLKFGGNKRKFYRKAIFNDFLDIKYLVDLRGKFSTFIVSI